MKITTVIVLACVTVGIGVGAALVASRGRAVEKSEVATEKLFPELTQDKINAVELVSIKKRDKEFTFKRTATGWESPDKGGYTVKIEKIKEVLLGLSQLKKVEAKTSKPENYSKIGVESLVKIAPLERVHRLITDGGISPHDRLAFTQRGIEVSIADGLST